MKTKLKRRYDAKAIAKKATFELKNKYFNVFLNKFDVKGMESSAYKKPATMV